MIEQQLMTTDDAARRLNISTVYVRKLESSGKLKAMRTISGKRIFLADEVERLAVEREAKRQAKAS
jgi:excisionase family DNA binding protein